MTTLIEADTAAEAAALWWAQQVGAPVFRAVDERSSREDHENMGFASVMQTMISDRYPVDADQGAKFVKALTKTIRNQLKRSGTFGVSLDVDYGPCRELAEAAEAAGIHLSRFPWKTHMGVKADHVVAGLGYRAPMTLVWQAPDWQRPTCGIQRYEQDASGDYSPRDETCGLPRYHDSDHGDWQPDLRVCASCGLSYAGHYHRRDRGGYTHSWEPATQEVSA